MIHVKPPGFAPRNSFVIEFEAFRWGTGPTYIYQVAGEWHFYYDTP